jgi:hypothetical protein
VLDCQRNAQIVDETLEVGETQVKQVADERPRHVSWQRR